MPFVIKKEQLEELAERLTQDHKENAGSTAANGTDRVAVSLMVQPLPSSGTSNSFDCPHCGVTLTVSG